jgi:hypothetical protein
MDGGGIGKRVSLRGFRPLRKFLTDHCNNWQNGVADSGDELGVE